MRALLSSCQVQEKAAERKCSQGQECPGGQEMLTSGREELMLGQAGTRSWSSWPPGLPGATAQDFPKQPSSSVLGVQCPPKMYISNTSPQA